jgi:hypothetical protein
MQRAKYSHDLLVEGLGMKAPARRPTLERSLRSAVGFPVPRRRGLVVRHAEDTAEVQRDHP